MELLVYFAYNGQGLPFTDQLLWFVNHDPDIQTRGMAEAMYRSTTAVSETSRERIKAAWEQSDG